MKEIFLLKLGEIVLKGANKRQFENKLRPVSYTHLDVYKRQGVYGRDGRPGAGERQRGRCYKPDVGGKKRDEKGNCTDRGACPQRFAAGM